MLPSCDSAETLESGQELHEVVAGVLVVLPEHVILVTGPEDSLLLAVAVEELKKVVLVLGDLVEECLKLCSGNIEVPLHLTEPSITSVVMALEALWLRRGEAAESTEPCSKLIKTILFLVLLEGIELGSGTEC